MQIESQEIQGRDLNLHFLNKILGDNDASRPADHTLSNKGVGQQAELHGIQEVCVVPAPSLTSCEVLQIAHFNFEGSLAIKGPDLVISKSLTNLFPQENEALHIVHGVFILLCT